MGAGLRGGGRSHEAGQEAEDDEAAVDEVEEIGVLRAQVQRREDGAASRNGRGVQAVHERHETDHAQNADDLVDGGDRGARQVHPAADRDGDEADLRVMRSTVLRVSQTSYLAAMEMGTHASAGRNAMTHVWGLIRPCRSRTASKPAGTMRIMEDSSLL